MGNARLRLIRQSAEYQRILQLAKELKDAILLDVGCCCTFLSQFRRLCV